MQQKKPGWDFRVIEQLRREKAAQECRDILWGEVSEQTGICAPTLLRLRTRERIPRIDADTLNALCQYFGVSEEIFRPKAHASPQKDAGDRV